MGAESANWVDGLTGNGPLASDDRARGFRYRLPRPFVSVTPNRVGSADVAFFMVPDEAEEYYVSAWAVAATQKFDLDFTPGHLLGAVTYNPNNTSVPDNLVKSFQELGTTTITQLDKRFNRREELDLKILEAELEVVKASNAVAAAKAQIEAHKSVDEAEMTPEQKAQKGGRTRQTCGSASGGRGRY